MYKNILAGLSKIEKEAQFLRKTWLPWYGGVILPSEATRAVATCSIINAVGILDEALALFINTNYAPTARKVDTLQKKIDYIFSNAGKIDSKTLHKIREIHNSYAHEADKYGTWDELDYVISQIRAELNKLGIC